MLSIDDAIEQFKYDAECNRADLDLSYAEENEQVAEWLEELKAYREIGTVEECRNSILEIPKAYNKAIDDCKELTFREVVYCDSLNDRTEFRELAEQLKAKNNERKGVTKNGYR